ncbi:non-ribosomal peptide synthetase family protein [Nitzschia inconspicua]|uniref:Non-ribosomal peptide synthetase family protein n=1 Tax=Nitzschia inconspicua TaxID=303405 RepID=A0A9K3KT34_9STRA|nr:non-ribosomal peptide synthetase family protein [Nitzschia inconspicua]
MTRFVDGISSYGLWDRPAVLWDDSLLESRTSSNGGCCYWTLEILELLKRESLEELPSTTASKGNYAQNEKLFGISYKTLFLLAAAMSHQIQQEYFQNDDRIQTLSQKDTENGVESRAVRIATAIPEGPLLPLAVLVVHALNVDLGRRKRSNGASQQYAVFIPIEPSEAKERNIHILQDARPALILAVPGMDMDRMKELEQHMDKESDILEHATDRNAVIDFVAIAKKAKQSLEMLETRRLDAVLDYLSTKEGQSMTLQDYVIFMSRQLFGSTSELEYYSGPLPTQNRVSHVVYTSGTTGRPKGCVSSINSLRWYLSAKNKAHDISSRSTVLLASSLSFDPCLSDILATFHAGATLAIAPRRSLLSDLRNVLKRLRVTHVLCTPTLWSLATVHDPNDSVRECFPYLERVALGGEPIPKRLVQMWARESPEQNDTKFRLLATYGVTEACVYQTCGEVFSGASATNNGQSVGLPLEGTGIRICKEEIQDALVDVETIGQIGEVVIYGKQVDELTGYLNRLELKGKFVAEQYPQEKDITYHYRSGDRGMIDPLDGSLKILGRIVGEEGMIKINGVRVELGEIESAVVDTIGEVKLSEPSIVLDCLAVLSRENDCQPSILAYCILSTNVCQELGLVDPRIRGTSFIINGNPLWTLLRWRCTNRLKAACVPTAFVAIPCLPLSPTGKRDRSKLPKLETCQVIPTDLQMTEPLKAYGSSGEIVSNTINEVLNLQPCQQQLLTKSASFAMMGGDSLSATLVARTLYAHHLQVENSRFLGGERGQLPEPFTVVNLINARSLGDYVDMLDKKGFCTTVNPTSQKKLENSPESSQACEPESSQASETTCSEGEALYEALLQATTLGQTTIAIELLKIGADPNFGAHGGRIGKTSGRLQQRAIFKANPLHLACTKGDHRLVHALLQSGANFKSPNTNGVFPIHLAAGTFLNEAADAKAESWRRLECVKMLLDAGCPLLMRDANKQSILHAAARAGHSSIIEFCIEEYYAQFEQGESRKTSASIPPSHFINWYDHWYRTAVHWATLNGRVQALRVLLERGCNPSPTQPNPNKYTSMAKETPLEICQRVHGGTGIGFEMERLLLQAIEQQS